MNQLKKNSAPNNFYIKSNIYLFRGIQQKRRNNTSDRFLSCLCGSELMQYKADETNHFLSCLCGSERVRT
ncbi:hypothetical protein, partial [Yersinia kristensenii]|uniref:hypothetical protein n=1 Tax=Yersinia kristensenii TaxID=28152 RepID=UPI001C0F054D